MIGVEKEILVLMSQVRCATEQQFSKFFSKRKRVVRSPYKKTLRRMCKEFTLKKYPCNIAYGEFKDSSGIYYLNGGSIYKGKELLCRINHICAGFNLCAKPDNLALHINSNLSIKSSK